MKFKTQILQFQKKLEKEPVLKYCLLITIAVAMGLTLGFVPLMKPVSGSLNDMPDRNSSTPDEKIISNLTNTSLFIPTSIPSSPDTDNLNSTHTNSSNVSMAPSSSRSSIPSSSPSNFPSLTPTKESNLSSSTPSSSPSMKSMTAPSLIPTIATFGNNSSDSSSALLSNETNTSSTNSSSIIFLNETTNSSSNTSSAINSTTFSNISASEPSFIFSILPSNTPSVVILNLTSFVPSTLNTTLSMDSNSTAPSLFPSKSPSSVPLSRDQLVMMLTAVSNLDNLNDDTTYQNKALNWIVNTSQFDSNTDLYLIKQKYILAALYYATEGDKWRHSYDFLSSETNECEWKGSPTGILGGVQECDNNSHVTKLSLESVGMVGTIPEELGYLTSLQSLNFDNNILEGTIPTQTFRYLEFLTEAKFETNSLSGNVTTLCEIWGKNNITFHLDRDEIFCPCCTCCPFDTIS